MIDEANSLSDKLKVDVLNATTNLNRVSKYFNYGQIM